jgi:hypothetical protein
MKDNEVKFKKIKSVTFDNSLIEDFLYVENSVFHLQLGVDYFKRKFEKNIYGPSIIVLVYIDDKPVAADALWRNDIDGVISYQSSDTAVLSNCRGRGVFRKMVDEKLSLVENDAIVYGFPNQNSYPGFMKMGWRTIGTYYTGLYYSYKKYIATHDKLIDSKYVLWWFKGRKGYYCARRGCRYFIVAKRNSLIYSIIGEVERDVVSSFPTINGMYLLLYKTTKCGFLSLNRVPMRIIVKNADKSFKVPVWKMDAL